jgi:hypothetical protein
VLADNRSSYKIFITPHLVDAEKGVRASPSPWSVRAEETRLREKLASVPESGARIRSKSSPTCPAIRCSLRNPRPERPAYVAVPVRTYPYRELGGHAVGYVDLRRHQETRRRHRAGDRTARASKA